MYAKVVSASGRERLLPQFAHMEAKTVAEDSPLALSGGEPGVTLEFRIPPDKSRGESETRSLFVKLPQDGEAVYIMNDSGKTIGTYRWPLPARTAGPQAKEAAR